MHRISLVNMPFAALQFPSLALTQLKAVTEAALGDEVRVRILYVNHDVAQYLGVPLYQHLANSVGSNTVGFGDWFFRQAAFDELEDNEEEYFQRFFPARDARFELRRQALVAKRRTLDAFLGRLIARTRLDEEHLVGFTSMFCQNAACFALAKRLKALNPNLLVVMGGANCETPMGEVIATQVPDVDFVFSGPALVSFPAFVRHWIDGTAHQQRIRGVFSARSLSLPGTAGALGEELPVEHPIALEYDSFLDEIDARFPESDIKPVLTFETSRGCWWGERAHCTFCGLNGSTMKYRSMSAGRALAQFERLFGYAARTRRFESVDNILPKHYLSEVFPHLTPPEACTIFYEVKADLAREDLAVLARAGVTEIQPGIESLATSTLRLMKKGTTASQNIVFLKNCLTYGVRPAWNLLIGFPGETEDVYRKYLVDLPLLRHLPPPSGAYPVRFDRYSPYHAKPADYQLDLQVSDFYRFIYPFDDRALEDLAYYFVDRSYSAPYQCALSAGIDTVRGQVAAWLAAWQNGPASAPRLVMAETPEACRIVDSRGGAVVDYAIDQPTREALAYLDTPRRRDALGAWADRLDWLTERGLLFNEGDRYVSLVTADLQ